MEAFQLPCGKCTGCRLEHSRQWAIRCHHEASLHTINSFVTLTYSPSFLPCLLPSGAGKATLVKKHLTLFLKRLRHHQGPFRFFACGEYGEQLGRPHYHICFFGWEPPDQRQHKLVRGNMLYTSQILDDIWGKGFTLTGSLTFQSSAYVARYIMKKITGDQANTHYQNVDPDTGETSPLQPEFTIMSRRPGIAKAWFDKYYLSDVKDDDLVTIKGRKMRPPRYYDKLFEQMDPDAFHSIRAARMQHATNQAANNTPERLKVRETIANSKLKPLKRELDTNE